MRAPERMRIIRPRQAKSTKSKPKTEKRKNLRETGWIGNEVVVRGDNRGPGARSLLKRLLRKKNRFGKDVIYSADRLEIILDAELPGKEGSVRESRGFIDDMSAGLSKKGLPTKVTDHRGPQFIEVTKDKFPFLKQMKERLNVRAGDRIEVSPDLMEHYTLFPIEGIYIRATNPNRKGAKFFEINRYDGKAGELFIHMSGLIAEAVAKERIKPLNSDNVASLKLKFFNKVVEELFMKASLRKIPIDMEWVAQKMKERYTKEIEKVDGRKYDGKWDAGVNNLVTSVAWDMLLSRGLKHNAGLKIKA